MSSLNIAHHVIAQHRLSPQVIAYHRKSSLNIAYNNQDGRLLRSS